MNTLGRDENGDEILISDKGQFVMMEWGTSLHGSLHRFLGTARRRIGNRLGVRLFGHPNYETPSKKLYRHRMLSQCFKTFAHMGDELS